MVVKFPLAVVITGHDVSLESTLGKADMRLRTTAKVAGQVGRALTLGVSVPLTAMGALAIRTGTKVETNLLQIKAAADLTKGEMEELHSFARGFQDMGVGVREATEGMVDFAKAGLDVGGIKNVMTPSILLAKNEAVEFGIASKGLIGVLTGYRKPFSDAGKVADQLTFAAQATTNSIEELFDAFTQGGPIGAGFNQTFEDTTAVLALMGQANFKATLGGTAYRNGLSRLASQSAETTARLEKLKITQDKIKTPEGNLRRFVDILGELERAGADAEDMLVLFGERGGPGLAALMGQGVQTINRFSSNVSGALGDSMKKYNVTMSGAKGAQDRLMASLQNLADSIASSGLLDSFTKVVNRIEAWTKAFDELSPAAKDTWVKIGAGLIVMGPLITLFSKSYLLYQTAKALRTIAIAQAAVGATAAAATPKVVALNTATSTFAGFLKLVGPAVAFAMITGGINKDEHSAQSQENLAHHRLKAISAEAGVNPYRGWMGPPSTQMMESRIAELQRAGFGSSAAFQKLEVIFKNTPAGTRVNAGGADSVDVDVGYAMSTP